MILITHIVILTILGLDLAAFCIIIGRRYYTGRLHARLDSERAACAEPMLSLASNTEFTEIALLRRPPGGAGWTAIEGELFRALKSPEANKGYIRLFFDLLGYTGLYIGTLKSGKEWEQAAALEKLGRLKCASSVTHIIEALDSEKRDVRNMAAYSLGEVKSDESFSSEAVAALVNQIKRVAIHNEESSIRIIKSALISYGDRALPTLLPELKNDKWRVRAAVVDILAEIGTHAVIQPLIDILTDTERDVRAKAAKGLGKITDISSVPPLSLITKTKDPFWVVRLHVVRALGLIKDPIAIECIKERLGDNKWQVRSAAATALGTIGAEAYLVLVEQYLKSNDQYTREQVQEELAHSGIIDSLVDFVLKNRDRLPPIDGPNGSVSSSTSGEQMPPLINGGTIPPAVYVKIAGLLVSSGTGVPAEVIMKLTREGMGRRERTMAIEILNAIETGAGPQPDTRQ
ncbi:MAG: HEAT repeat domain-containing protein [Proteobacteria bacterium]|nr:HEAT repeat domain-containing protein [Pseudomonadota bacterium]